ncbi:PadR family transcriptional regulator [Candidatus Micrarchaeota archaeon]|nr:PadR family transcriptional regulator [Candidatus Micrarchaeota archaeon]
MKKETKPFKRLKRHLTSENLWLPILSIIGKDGEAYAYALPDEMERRFGFSCSRVMVYIVLHMLESQKLIKSSEKGRRKYYTLTKEGKDTLNAAKAYLRMLSASL